MPRRRRRRTGGSMLTEQGRANIGPAGPEGRRVARMVLADRWPAAEPMGVRHRRCRQVRRGLGLVELRAWEKIPQGEPFGSLGAMKEGLNLGSQCLGTCLCEPGPHQHDKPGTDSRSAQPEAGRDALGRKHPHFRLVPETGWPAVEGIWPAGPRVEGLGGLGLNLTRIPASVIHR